MIVRHLITCATCEAPHTLRIQVGHENYQEHAFQCAGCGEQIVVGMEVDHKNVSLKIVDKENCRGGSSEGVIVNLSPSFPVLADQLHQDLAFPAMDHIRDFMAAQMALGARPVLAADFANQRDKMLANRPSVLWPILDKAWSLHSRGRHDLAQAKVDEYFGESGTTKALAEAQFDFCQRMLAPGRISIFEDLAKFASEANTKYPDEFERFVKHFRDNLFREDLDRFHETFKEYFSCYTDFSQTLMHSQLDIAIPPDYEATSAAFAKTKLFYGNAFENLTTNVAVLACLNNVAKGRRFHEFQSMDLKKYLTIDKANRCNPFKDEPALMAVGRCLDSTIRNASHHGGMRLINRGRQIQYRSGGSGAQRTMRYLDYVKMCNEILLSSCALCAFQLMIVHD